MIGIQPGNVFANYIHLQGKHPDQFPTPQDVKDHVQYVFDAPEHVLPGSDPNNKLIVRRNGADRSVVLQVELRGGKYRVRSAFILTPGQLEIKQKKK